MKCDWRQERGERHFSPRFCLQVPVEDKTEAMGGKTVEFLLPGIGSTLPMIIKKSVEAMVKPVLNEVKVDFGFA